MYYGGYGIGYGFFDPTYLLVLVGIVICAIASWNVKATFSRYKQVRSRLGMTGAQAAEQVADDRHDRVGRCGVLAHVADDGRVAGEAHAPQKRRGQKRHRYVDEIARQPLEPAEQAR